jgi:hypothetical protein
MTKLILLALLSSLSMPLDGCELRTTLGPSLTTQHKPRMEKDSQALQVCGTICAGGTESFSPWFSRKLVGYALGRAVLPTDKPLIDTMQHTLLSGDATFASAVTTLVQSRQFNERRNDP